MKTNTRNNLKEFGFQDRVLLLLLPFWAPLIPSLGISCLKTFLEKRGYSVTAVDANIEEEFREIYEEYFNFFRENIPGNKLGNLYIIGYDVLRNHMMMHLHFKKEKGYRYLELLKTIVFKNFYWHIDHDRLLVLKELLDKFYLRLEDYLTCLLDREKPGVIGLSVYGDTLPASLFAFELTKKRYPPIKTVMGGGVFSDQLAIGTPNFDFFLEKTAPYIDKIIVGEGEILFYKLLNGELPGSQRVYTLRDINQEVLDLSSANIPDFSNFKLGHYPYLSAYTSRSCPFQCGFCSETIQWGRYRKKKALQVVDELTRLYHKHNKQLFYLGDSLLNPTITDFARELEKLEVSIYWEGYLKVDKDISDLEKVFLWRRGGFYKAWLGLESGAQPVLDLMDKQITVEQIKIAVSSLAHAGIKTSTLWIVGYPGETQEHFQQTLDLITELADDIFEVWCSPFSYYLSGQVNSGNWLKQSVPLYPESALDMLILQTWMLNTEPSREETYRRMNKLIEHCQYLGIPLPYSLSDIYTADQRWKRLQQNAVPSLMEFATYIDECKNIEKLFLLQNQFQDQGDFNF